MKTNSAVKNNPGDPVKIPIIYIDGVCLLCERTINFIYKRSNPGSFYFALLQNHSDIAAMASGEDVEFESTVVKYQDHYYFKAEAVLFILKRMKTPYPWLGKCIGVLPKWLLDFFYQFIARNRFRWFKKKATCSLPTTDTRKYFID